MHRRWVEVPGIAEVGAGGLTCRIDRARAGGACRLRGGERHFHGEVDFGHCVRLRPMQGPKEEGATLHESHRKGPRMQMGEGAQHRYEVTASASEERRGLPRERNGAWCVWGARKVVSSAVTRKRRSQNHLKAPGAAQLALLAPASRRVRFENGFYASQRAGAVNHHPGVSHIDRFLV